MLFRSPAPIAAEVPQYAEILEKVQAQFPGASERERFQEALRRLIDLLVSGLIEGTAQAAGAARAGSAAEVRRHPVRLAAFTPETQVATRRLKQLLHREVYGSEALAEERRRSSAMIAELFEFFVAHPDRLPGNYRQELSGRPAHRVVCDYLAGMTDGFFHRAYQQTFSPPSA